ncbi:CBS domain-containing protein [Flectobacillus major]|jgi:CBS domain-containing protein|uniref:CBS domain-containing protein n=1 Tax=Flectobacillus major TaxID=103 RepID=UPI0003F62E22|nr:CBS domain-containing protein [Flectobacillus major]
MKKVSHIILHKGNTVNVIDSSKTVFEALEIMISKNIGALVIYQDGEYKGLLTERDYARKVAIMGKNSHDTLVSEIMQTNPASVKFEDTIEYCMEIMSDKHIRYLPVLADNHVVGLVSMGDLVRFIIEDQKHTINHLQNFISGGM